ncbi:uncharacterized protein LOC143531884 [Bidens hawaiensis]|uniref:uncharacterized protein LOC143531884 n=1 Tax=Bidens hawaiensis TaxID=980011 RepID=UPI00404AF0C2
MKVKAECEGKVKDYETRYLDELAFKSKAEEEKELLVLELKARRNEIDAAMKVNGEYEREIRGYEKRSLDELELRTKAEEEKDRLVSVNSKLNDELKTKQNVIDVLMKVNAEFEEKSRVYEKRSMDDLELKKKAEEEKELLVLENLKLVDELKMKQNEIDAVMKVIAEHEGKTRVCKNRSLESDSKVFSSEKLAIESVGSGKEKKDCASESDRKQPLVSVKKDSKRKTEVKLPEIIDIDDDDLEFVPTNKRRQVLNEKTELRYVSRLYSTCRNN